MLETAADLPWLNSPVLHEHEGLWHAQVQERLNRLVHKHQGGIILIEGDPGMGKSRLLEELEHTSMGQRASLDKDRAQDLPAAPEAPPGLKKLCNVFVANGDLANKSKVTVHMHSCCMCSFCQMGHALLGSCMLL